MFFVFSRQKEKYHTRWYKILIRDSIRAALCEVMRYSLRPMCTIDERQNSCFLFLLNQGVSLVYHQSRRDCISSATCCGISSKRSFVYHHAKGVYQSGLDSRRGLRGLVAGGSDSRLGCHSTPPLFESLSAKRKVPHKVVQDFNSGLDSRCELRSLVAGGSNSRLGCYSIPPLFEPLSAKRKVPHKAVLFFLVHLQGLEPWTH